MADKKVELLSDDDSDVDQKSDSLRVNKAFASKYEERKRRDELAKARDLLDQEEEESDSETEDEDAELLSAELDLQIINTINSIKKKDPKIYDASSKWFDATAGDDDDNSDSDENADDGEQKKVKRMTFKDLARAEILKGQADLDDEMTDRKQSGRSGLSYDRDQESFRKAFLEAAGGDDSGGLDGEEDGDVLHVKVKNAAEQAEEERRLQKALKEMKDLAMQDDQEDKEKVEFLTSYLTNKLWQHRGIKFSDRDQEEDSELDDEVDEAEVEAADLFESKYNFRFEELQDSQNQAFDTTQGGELRQKVSFDLSHGGVQVLGHARQVADSLRRDDEKRKQQREARKDRKEKEKRQKEAELRRLKNLKRQEVSREIILPMSSGS